MPADIEAVPFVLDRAAYATDIGLVFLDDRDRFALFGEQIASGQARRARADNGDVDIDEFPSCRGAAT